VKELKISEIYYNKFKEDNKLFSSHWDVTSRCNYRCSYCTYKNKDEKFYPYEHTQKIINFYDYFYKNYNLSLLLFGGEPLIHPDILKIVERLGISKYPLQIFTNLSRSKSFLKKLCSIRDDLKFFTSFHYEYADPDKFLEKVNLVQDMAKIHVKIMWDSTKKDQIRAIYDKFSNNLRTIDMIYHPNQTFTKEDKDWYIQEHRKNNSLQLYNVDGEFLSYHEVKIRMNGMANFQGYHCDAGKRSLMVCSNGDVYPCLTYRKNHEPIFNVIKQPIYFTPNICTEPECYSEIGIPKYKRKIPKLVCMVIGEKCNWNCGYCDRPKIKKQRDVNVELVEKYYPKIVEWIGDDCDIHISGGETALVDEEVLDYLFSFNKKLIVETNGLFFDKYFYKYYNSIKKVVYHCVPELDQEIKYHVDDSKVEYLIVVHHLNIYLLKDFLKEDRNWVLQYYYPKFLGEHEKYQLTRSDYFYIARYFPHLVDKREIAKRIAEPDNIDELRSKCFKRFDFVGFDFVNGKIKFCKQSHSFTNFTELNDKNFDFLVRDKLKSGSMDRICETCTEVIRYF